MRVRWEIADLQRNLDDEVHEEHEAPVPEPVVEPPPPLMDDEEDEMDLVELREAHTADNQPIADMRMLSGDEKIAAITKANAMALERARTFGKRDRE